MLGPDPEFNRREIAKFSAKDAEAFPHYEAFLERNDLKGSCPGLARDSDIMVVRQFGSSTCSGAFFHLVDRSSGIRGPTCVFGEFVPYRKPAGDEG